MSAGEVLPLAEKQTLEAVCDALVPSIRSAGADDPELLLADCDLPLARSKASSPRNDAHADRRTDLYR